MKIQIKNLLCFFVVCCISTSCFLSNKNILKEGDKFCKLGISYFDALLKDVEYVLCRSANGYMFDLKNDYRIFVVTQPNSQFLYKEIFPMRDTVFYDLDLKSEYLKQRYGIEVKKVKEIIKFCTEENVIEIVMRENPLCYFFISPSYKIIYREVEPTFYYDEKICKNWYLIQTK